MSSLFSLFAENILPVFLTAGAGFALASAVKINPGSLSRVIFYIFSPALVFSLLTRNQLDNGAIAAMFSFAFVQMLLVALIAWLAARALNLSRPLTVALVLGALLPNAGNYGLSVNLFAFGEEGLAQASLYFIASGVMANTVGVYLASLGRSNYRSALIGLLKIPAIYAVLLAFMAVRFEWQIPSPLERSISILSDAAIPSMLVLLGVLLRGATWRGNVKALLLANGLRLLVAPALAFLLTIPFGLAGAARQAGVLEAAMPAAVMTTVLTSEFDVEPAFMTSVVFTTTLLSPLTLTPLLGVLGA